MVALIRNRFTRVFSFLTGSEPGLLRGQRVAVLVTYPPPGGQVYILPEAIRERLSFKGARAFIPRDNAVGRVTNGCMSIDAEFVLSCYLTVQFGRRAGENSREVSNQYLLQCWVWDQQGYGLLEKVFREFDSPCEPDLGRVFRELAEQAAGFAKETILRRDPTEVSAA